MRQWNLTKLELPCEGMVVLTCSDGGLEQKLIRKGNLWFHEDMSMYVYYTPKYWLYI